MIYCTHSAILEFYCEISNLKNQLLTHINNCTLKLGMISFNNNCKIN